MSLTKVNYIDNSTIITAKNLNDIQDNIVQNAELIKKAAPRNLLDNSDFTNPVNQRGYTGALTTGYAIDRWFFLDTSATLLKDGIAFSGTLIYQYLENIGAGKTVTGVVCLANGTKYIQSGTIPLLGEDTQTVFNYGHFAVNLSARNLLQFILDTESISSIVAWVALYEGEYTIDTLPEYQPKGYGAELTECRRYLRRFGTWDPVGNGYTKADGSVVILIPIEMPMRITPTAHSDNWAFCFYMNGNWVATTNPPTTIVNYDHAVELRWAAGTVGDTYRQHSCFLTTETSGFELNAEL